MHEDAVRQFIRAITIKEKFPFSSPQLRKALSHTLWYMHYIESAKALNKLLEKDEVFRVYDIIPGTGDGSDNGDEDTIERTSRKVIDRVRGRNKDQGKNHKAHRGPVCSRDNHSPMDGCDDALQHENPSSYMQGRLPRPDTICPSHNANESKSA